VPSHSGYKNVEKSTHGKTDPNHRRVNSLSRKRQSNKTRVAAKNTASDNTQFWKNLKQGAPEDGSSNEVRSLENVKGGWYGGSRNKTMGDGVLSKGRATISCWVTLTSRKDLFKYVDQMVGLKNKAKVNIGEIVVFNREHENKQLLKEQVQRDRKLSKAIHFGEISAKEASKIAFKKRGIKAKMKSLGAKWTGLLPVDEVVSKLGVRNSPVWLISVDGKTHVFEGEYFPANLVSADGRFRVGDLAGLKRKPDPMQKDIGDFVLYRRKHGTHILHNRKNYPGNGFIYSFD
jgi:hypothetical protein